LDITIYTTNNCSYCKKAKEYLTKYGLDYKEMVVDKLTNVNVDAFRTNCPNKTTVPQILINNKLLGGYAELLAYFIKK